MGKHVHFVHNDEIWKDHVHREMQSFIKKWPESWGFLKTEYTRMNRILVGKRGTPSPTPPTSDRSLLLQKPQKLLRLPPIQGANLLKGIKPGFPVTTAQEVGWKSTKKDCLLEKYGRHARGQTGIRKLFNWPREGLE
ncbi:uncharacterized protein C20orf85 [Lingula anatina]|uniref:Uncharacterized protein C20orf85 n=1 Tax=Lingula anatina TaxID=7574 RepID=A0A1S3JBR1_LINAN|nr:uncharacterized protein C20orf85 [Lingula anatina]|eukprot:XP_013407845.1 uncharacterized protein C20orf85 [Lingula anatina]